MNSGGGNYTPALRRHVNSNHYGAPQPWGYPSDYPPYSSGYTPGYNTYNQTLAPSYGRSVNQTSYYSYNQYTDQQQNCPSSYPYMNYNQFYQTPNYFVTPSYPSSYSGSNLCPNPAINHSNGSEVSLRLPTYAGVMVSSKGLEFILIAILILVALDLIIVRPQKN